MILRGRPACKEQNWTKGQRTTKWLAQPARGNVLNHQTAFHAQQQYGVPIQRLPALSNQARRSAATEIPGMPWAAMAAMLPTTAHKPAVKMPINGPMLQQARAAEITWHPLPVVHDSLTPLRT